MCGHKTNMRAERTSWRTLAMTLSVGLLISCGIPMPHAQAQAPFAGQGTKPDKPDTTDKTDKSDAKKAPASLGDDMIDPNQPIKPGFMISVSVAGEPDPSGNYTVDPGGNITIKYANIPTTLRVTGLTPHDAEKSIINFLKTYIKNPVVSVAIVSVPRPRVTITGAIRTPINGDIIIANDSTLADVLTRVELSENADLTNVRIIRIEKVNGQEERVSKTYHVDRYLNVKPDEKPDDTQNPILHDRDKIYVSPKLQPSKGTISVTGEVEKPQRDLPLIANQPMTVREAISLAGGAHQGANLKAVTIRRPSLDKPLIIDLEKAEQGDPVYNIELKADDSIYVEKLENSAYIYVNGGFIKPGKFVYDKRTTLTEAIMEAGGLAPFAKIKDGTIFRHPDDDPKHTRTIAFNWIQIQKGKSPDIELHPGDSVWIAQGTAPKPAPDVFQILGGLGQAAYLYNAISGRASVIP